MHRAGAVTTLGGNHSIAMKPAESASHDPVGRNA